MLVTPGSPAEQRERARSVLSGYEFTSSSRDTSPLGLALYNVCCAPKPPDFRKDDFQGGGVPLEGGIPLGGED